VKIVNLGKKLKSIRMNAGLSQRVFAMRIGTTQQNVSNYENGLTELSLDCLTRIASEFSVSLDELLLGKSVGIEQEIFDIVAIMPEERKWLSKKILQTMLEDDNT
jgi:transcriptional regulator with XRE-family HTH domain